MCARNDVGRGARHFLKKNYKQIKRLNPRLPFLVRHFDGIAPKLTARYDYGGEAHRDLSNLSEEECLEKLRELVELGNIALKANIYPWQESVPKDTDIVYYDRQDPKKQHL